MSFGKVRPSQTLRIDVLPHFDAKPGGKATRFRKKSDTQRNKEGILSDEDCRQLFTNGYDATLITDLNGIVQETNLRATEILGYGDQQLIGQSVLTMVSGADENLLETIRTTLVKERFVRISAWCMRADGSFFAAEIAVNDLQSGHGQHLCFFLRDETRRRQAEEELNTTHNALRNAGTGIAVVALDGRLIYVNPALNRIFRRPADYVLAGRQLSDLLEDACAATAVIETIKAGQVWEAELVLSDLTAGNFWVQAQAAPNYDSENQLIGMVVSFVDISDKIRMEQSRRELERNQVMMQSLGAACHHLGQPATVLLSSIELMSRSNENDPELFKELLGMSVEAANLLRKTLHELNDIRDYKVVPYLQSKSTDSDHSSSIIDINSNSGNPVVN
jgi:PAS domain S-box-containing protein